MAMRYERPSSVKLASVKHELYHPRLPTLRRMDMDNTTHKLPTEHSRTTTACSREDFINSRSTMFPRREPLHCKNVLSKGTETAIQSFKPLKNESYTESWSKILGALSSKHEQSQQTEQLQIIGLAVRRKHPNITSSWVLSQTRPMTAPPYSRPTTPKPIPATMYSRYRTTAYRFSTSNPWK